VRICKIYAGVYPWEVRVEKVARTLAEAGHEVHLLCRRGPEQPLTETIDGITVHRCVIPGRLPRKLERISTIPVPLNPVWTRRLIRIVREFTIELLLVRDIPLALNALAVGQQAGIPVVLDMAENYPAMLRDLLRWSNKKAVHLLFKNSYLAALVERRVVRQCHHILVVVEESLERLVQMGISSETISIVSNTPRLFPLDVSRSDTSSSGDGQPLRLIYVGGLQVGRGLEEMLYALREFRRRCRIRLTILGEGPTRARLELLSGQLGLNESVRFRGWVDPAIVPAYIRDSDVGVVPHIVTRHTNTTIPNKLFDYMAHARPVLVSDAGPMQRIVRQEHCGLCYRSGDVDDIVRKLGILSDPDMRVVLGSNGRRAVVERYNWSQDGATLVTTIQSVIAKQGGDKVPSVIRARAHRVLK